MGRVGNGRRGGGSGFVEGYFGLWKNVGVRVKGGLGSGCSRRWGHQGKGLWMRGLRRKKGVSVLVGMMVV